MEGVFVGRLRNVGMRTSYLFFGVCSKAHFKTRSYARDTDKLLSAFDCLKTYPLERLVFSDIKTFVRQRPSSLLFDTNLLIIDFSSGNKQKILE